MLSPVVLGIDFGGTKTALAVARADGARLGTVTVQTPVEQGAGASLRRAVGAARELLGEVAAGQGPAAVGVATIGVPGEDGAELAPNIPGWSGLALRRELRQAFPGAEIRLANDVKAAAQAEAETGALRGCDPGIYLNLGTGLAVALVVGGRVVAGHRGASGEIGYNLLRVADVGRPAAGRVPLEDVVSGRALGSAAADLLPPGRDAEQVFARAAHDPRAARALDRFLTELAFHLVNLANVVDPERIAVGGGMVRSWDALHGRLRHALDAAVPYPPQLVPAAYPYDAPLRGALGLGLSAVQHRSPL
ncbi:ROK family protein [Streptacidiphilus griseoplanus]|uniref:ROK family protein n=1 Tax=Peterkaempfera griseoplana TaxID=66896 RepID=UPI0006E26002|nr:ROK family protein [Peterkaempfera griseoplana]